MLPSKNTPGGIAELKGQVALDANAEYRRVECVAQRELASVVERRQILEVGFGQDFLARPPRLFPAIAAAIAGRESIEVLVL